MGRSDASGPAGRTGSRSKRLRTAKGRGASSARWLRRQIKDPYVQAAAAQGYRSRSAFKLAQIDDRFHLLKPGFRVADLGAAPGGWTQVAAERVAAGEPGGGTVFAVDLAEVEPVRGARFLRLDLSEPKAGSELARALGAPVDVVLSDMALPATGHAATDHLRVLALSEAALSVAKAVLKPGGAFVVKLLKGGAEGDLLAEIRRFFRTVRHAKPRASRARSAETYLVATGFRGRASSGD